MLERHDVPHDGERTPWFSGALLPVRRGVYLRKIHFGGVFGQKERFSYWDGKEWGGYSTTPQAAFDSRRHRSAYQSVEWCGLARKP